MKSARLKTIGIVSAFLLVLLAQQLVGQAQNPRPQSPATPNTKPATPNATTSAAPSADAERQQIWNSPNMLRARAWLEEYCERSAKITPAEKQQYMTELEKLSPTQMKLWLLKFDEQEEARQQQQAFFEQTRAAALSRAKTVDAAAQQSYAAINSGETQAANQAQQQLNTQSANEQSAETIKDQENVGPPAGYGPNGYNSYGGVHYHFHFYPY
jgi:hypothetical protein